MSFTLYGDGITVFEFSVISYFTMPEQDQHLFLLVYNDIFHIFLHMKAIPLRHLLFVT